MQMQHICLPDNRMIGQIRAEVGQREGKAHGFVALEWEKGKPFGKKRPTWSIFPGKQIGLYVEFEQGCLQTPAGYARPAVRIGGQQGYAHLCQYFWPKL